MKVKLVYIFLLSGVAFLGQASHTGRIFVDRNHNGVYDKGEKLMKGVLVSDGLHVVKSASDGSFELPGHARERFVFITTPSGYKTDQAYYQLIRENKLSYDFALQPYGGGIQRDGSHSFIHISDTEISTVNGHDQWAANLRDYAENEQTAFIIHTGDICYEKGLKAHIQLMNTENMNCPMFYCIGNHDLVKGKYGEELFEKLYGPVFYSFDVGNVHYIVTPMLGGDFQPGYTKEDVYRWMKNDLAQIPTGTPIMVFNHDLLTYGNQFIYGISEQEQINLNDHNLKAWIFGHWHINYLKKQGDVLAVSTATVDKGGIDHSTSAYRVLHVDKRGDVTSELRYSYLNKQLQIATPSDNHVSIRPNGSVPVTVNVYSSTSPVNEVFCTYQVDGQINRKQISLQQKTDWCWQAEMPLPAVDSGKKIVLKAKALFKNGEVVESETIFKYEPTPVVPDLKTDWTNLLGSPTHVLPAPLTGKIPMQLAWVTNVGASVFMTSPLVYEGVIYVASMDEDLKGTAHIYALEGKTGDLIWKYPVRNSIKNTIVIDNGRVLAQDVQGYLYAVDVKTGQLCWEKQLPVAGLPAIIEGLVASKGVVYAGTGKGLCAVDIKEGRILWQNKDWGQGEGTTSSFSVTPTMLISSSQWRGLYGNDLQTGKMKWKVSANGLRFRGGSAAVHGNLLYLISDESFFILDANTGRTVVRKKMPFSVDVNSTPLLTDKEIIFGTVKEGLVALDNETLEIKWQFRIGETLIPTAPYTRKPSATIESSPVLVEDVVYVGASDGNLYGIQKERGELVWKYTMGAPLFGTVAVSGNTLVAVDFAGNVYAFVFTGKEDKQAL